MGLVVVQIEETHPAAAEAVAHHQRQIRACLEVAALPAQEQVVELVGGVEQVLGEALRDGQQHVLDAQASEQARQQGPQRQAAVAAAPGAGHGQLGLGVAICLDEFGDAEQRVRLAVEGALVLQIALRGLGEHHLARRVEDGDGGVVEGGGEADGVAVHGAEVYRKLLVHIEVSKYERVLTGCK